MAISCPVNDGILFPVHNESNLVMQKPEYRGKSRNGQSRSVNTICKIANALETDKGFLLGRRYSPNSYNKNMKYESNNMGKNRCRNRNIPSVFRTGFTCIPDYTSSCWWSSFIA